MNAIVPSASTQPNGPAGALLTLSGLEPDNLLAFLALLGLLRALEMVRPQWHPCVAWRGTPMTADLRLAGGASVEEMVSAADAGIREIGRAYDFDRADITYKPEEFRHFAMSRANDRERSRLVAALASDGAVRRDGETVEPTSLCAMFGQGHQHFLSRLSGMATRDHPANALDLSRALFETWRYEDDTDGFRWDPIEDRRYAHQYGDPSENRNKIGAVTGANRLGRNWIRLACEYADRTGACDARYRRHAPRALCLLATRRCPRNPCRSSCAYSPSRHYRRGEGGGAPELRCPCDCASTSLSSR